MATPPQLVQFAFAAGLDESQQDEVLDPSAAFPVLENVRQDKRGGLTKRPGFSSLVRTRFGETARSSGARLFSYGTAPAVIDSAGMLDVYVEPAHGSVLSSRIAGPSYRVVPTLSTVDSVGSTSIRDIQYCGGLVAIAYSDERIAVVDAETGATVLPLEDLGVSTSNSYTSVALGACSDRYLFACFHAFEDGEVHVWILDVDDIGSGWTLLDEIADAISDVLLACTSLDDRIAVAFVDGATQTEVHIATYDATGQLATDYTTAAGVVNRIDIDASDDSRLWVAWAVTNDVYIDARAYDTLTAIGPAQLVDFGGGTRRYLRIQAGATDKARVILSEEASSRPQIRMQGVQVSGGAVVADGSTITVYNASPQSQPFFEGGRYYVFVGFDSDGNPVQRLHVLVDWTEDEQMLRPAANVLPGLATVPALSSNDGVIQVSRIDGTRLIGAVHAQNSASVTGSAMVSLDFGDIERGQTVDHAGATFISGGLLSVFDGDRATEAGFLASPPEPSVSTSGTGITGTYSYVAVYEDVDASGTWVVSGVSLPTSTGAITDKQVDVTVQTLSVSARSLSSTVRIALYRTTDSGTIYYLVERKQNDPTAATVAFSDNTADANLTSQPTLYAPTLTSSVGASLDRRAPPGLLHLESFNGMLVGSTGSSLRYSGQDVPGEATWFSPIFEAPVSGPGDITGIKAIDGTLYVFKRRSIFAASGEAPSDNGAAGGLGVPRQLAVDVGCITARSIVATSAGIFFQSDRGIELLSRSGAVAWIGEAVQRTLASYPVVTSAVLDDRNGLVRFTLAEDEASGLADGDGASVVFDLAIGTWQSVDSITGSSADEAAQDAATVYLDGSWRYAWLGVDGYVWYERIPPASSTSYSITFTADAGTDVITHSSQDIPTFTRIRVSTSGTLPTGLAADTDYWTVRQSATTSKLSTSFANARAGTTIDITAAGSGTHTATYTSATDAYVDGATWVAMAAETGWLKLGGIQGRQHVNKALLLARRSTSCDISAAITYDYTTTSEAAILRDSDDVDAVSTALDRIQLEYQLHDEAEGQAVKTRFSDATPSGASPTIGSGKGATWIALTFEGTPKQGAADLPEASM